MDGAFKLPREFTPAIIRLAGYSKNVTQIIPQNQQNYNQSTPAQFFLPQGIIDLRSLVMYFTVQYGFSAAGSAGTAEVQTITFVQNSSGAGATPTAGNAIFAFNNDSTSQLLLFGDTAAQLTTKLNAMPSIQALPGWTAGVGASQPAVTNTLASATLVVTFPAAMGPVNANFGAIALLSQGLVNATPLGINGITTITTPGVQSSAVALPRNIESLIDRYEFSIGGQNIHTGSVQYNTLFTDYLNQNSSSEFLAQRSVMQNAGPLSFYYAGSSTTQVPSQSFCISSWLGFLGCKNVIDTRKMAQCIIRIYFAQPTILPILGVSPTPSYVVTGNANTGAQAGVYFDCDTLQMPDLYDDVINMKIMNGGIEIPYMNWYSTEQTGTGAASISDFRFSFESQCITDLVAVIRKITYSAQASVDPVTGNSTFFKYEVRSLGPNSNPVVITPTGPFGAYAWNIFGKNYPEYYIPATYAHEQTLKALGKLSHVDCGTLYNTLSQYLLGYYSIRTSFEHVGAEFGYQSGLNTLGKTSQMVFKSIGNTAPADGGGYSLYIFVIATSVLRLLPNNQIDYIV